MRFNVVIVELRDLHMLTPSSLIGAMGRGAEPTIGEVSSISALRGQKTKDKGQSTVV